MSEQNYKVLCYSDETVLRGLKWATEHSLLHYNLEFYRGQLFSNTPEPTQDYDLILFFADLAQPVPVENLKSLGSKVGLCFFIQPTPQQLLSLAELAQIKPALWDGSNFNLVLEKIEKLLDQNRDQLRLEQFRDMAVTWISQNQKTPGHLEFLNPPETWQGAKIFPLDRTQVLLSVGDQKSSCDIRLPLNQPGEWGQLVFQNQSWVYRDRRQPNQPMEIKPGMILKIGSISLAVRLNSKVLELQSLVQSLGMAGIENQKLSNNKGSVFEAVMECLLGLRNGGLKVKRGGQSGDIFFEHGVLRGAVTGAVQGEKALFRMLSWSNSGTNIGLEFEHEALTPKTCSSLSVGVADFLSSYQKWLERYETFARLMPPPQLQFLPSPQNFLAKNTWTKKSFQVFHGVCAYQRSLEVINYVAANDVDIVEQLVLLKQQNMIIAKRA